MPIQTTDTDSLTFGAADHQWIVKAGVVIAATADNKNAVTLGFSGDRLLNHGDISSTGAGTSNAVQINRDGVNATIINGGTASIIGWVGVFTRADDTHVFNDGTLVGLSTYAVSLGGFTKRADIHNDGYIFGKSAAIRGETIDSPKVTNSGVIESDDIAISLNLFSGSAKIVNTGTIIGGNGTAIVVAGHGSVLENAGTIVGTVRLPGWAFDTVKVVNSGLIDGDLFLSSGADTYNGRRGTVEGTVFGGSDADALKGGKDDDTFSGGDLQDELIGRGGDDVLVGGARADRMKGGAGGDTFVYEDFDDSTGGFFANTRRDTIVDFRQSQDDRIDLRPIDAKIGGGNQKFDFIGTADFSGKKGELRYFVESGDAHVQADVNGNGNADMEIKLNDVSSLKAADFYL